LGEFVCYELDKVQSSEFRVQSSESKDDEYVRVCRYREQYKTITSAIKDNKNITSEFIEEFIENNPNYFQVYNTLGDYELSRKNYEQAISYWKQALMLEIPRTTEKDEITSKIKKYDKR
jgi:tetratricopeptide (TPR) repeat protein